MSRPRLLLVPEFTELTWTIKPQLAEWAEVASYDPPGVGAEPPPEEDVASLTRGLIADRGLPAPPSTSEDFGVAVREFCEEVSDRPATGPAARPEPARQPPPP